MISRLAASSTREDAPDCIHSLFTRQARLRRDAIALLGPEVRVSYAALDAWSSQLAWALRARGVGLGARVGLWMHRSPEAVASLLAVLKAGGAYVPLDPSLPRSRVERIVAQARPSAWVSEAAARDQLPPTDAPVLCVDTERQELEAHPASAPPGAGVQDDDLAYVMFTSGSTGLPKGVAIPHRGVVRLVQDVDYVEPGPANVHLLHSPLSFDASTFEIWGALLNGAALVVPPPGSLTLQELGAFITRFGVDTLWLTAALFHQMVEHAPEALGRLRQLLAGGDVLSVPHVRAFLQAAPGCRLINAYGPTEATTFACAHPVRELAPDARSVPIGRPISRTAVVLLDEQGRRVPEGEEGELCIGGDGLAWGYLDQPVETAAAFIPDPYGSRPGARLYRSGDRARVLPDGSLEFLGRRDHQIKLRGYRIELGELEAALGRHPDVAEAAAVARETGPGGRRLLAFVRLREGAAPSLEELRRHLAAELPGYMLPAAISVLASLPRGPTGKVDRSALPTPALEPEPPAQEGPATAVQAPAAGSTEARLLRIWRELFRAPGLGLDADFFALGGDSMLALQLFTLLHKEFDRSLPLTTLLEFPTVRGVARLLEEGGGDQPWPVLVRLREGSEQPPFFFIHGLGGEVLNFASVAPHLEAGRPVYGVRGVGLDGSHEPLTHLPDMAAAYLERLRLTQPEGPYFLGGYSSGAVIAYELAQQLLLQGQALGALVIFDEGAPRSGYERFRPQPGAILGALRNLPRWLAAHQEPGPWHWRSLARGWLVGLRQRLGGKVPALPPAAGEREPPRPSAYLERRLRFMVAQYQGLLLYTPRPLPERIHLLRARSQPLLCAHTPDMGWGRLARGGVRIREVEGHHLNLFRGRNAICVARRLGEVLRGGA